MPTIIQATVKYPAGRIWPSKYEDGGDRQNIMAALPNGGEERIYFPAHSPYECSLKKGDCVTLVDSGKGKLKIAIPQTCQTPATQPGNWQPTTHSQPQTQQPTQPQQPTRTHTELTPNEKREIAAYVDEQAGLFGYCMKKASEIGRDHDLEPTDTRAIATSIYIAAQKKFNL